MVGPNTVKTSTMVVLAETVVVACNDPLMYNVKLYCSMAVMVASNCGGYTTNSAQCYAMIKLCNTSIAIYGLSYLDHKLQKVRVLQEVNKIIALKLLN